MTDQEKIKELVIAHEHLFLVAYRGTPLSPTSKRILQRTRSNLLSMVGVLGFCKSEKCGAPLFGDAPFCSEECQEADERSLPPVRFTSGK